MERQKSPAQQVRASVTASGREKAAPAKSPSLECDLVPSGSTLLNLALADRASGGLPCGRVVNVIGDSSSGKTLLAMTALAMVAADPRWDDYLLKLDDAEDAFSFDIRHLFGAKLADRLDTSSRSATIQEFYGTVCSLIKSKQPFVYILDSLDALSSDDELARADKYADGKEVGGSYKMDKPKLLSELLRVITGDVMNTNSIIIIISQTRDNLDPFSFQKKTRSGGRALKFYCSHEIWLTLGQKLKYKERVVGVETIAKVTKNKRTGKLRDCRFNIYYDYGVDDIGSIIDWLVEEGFWTKKGQTIAPVDFAMEPATRDKLIRKIEEKNLESVLHELVQKCWNEVEDSLKLGRKPRFE